MRCWPAACPWRTGGSVVSLALSEALELAAEHGYVGKTSGAMALRDNFTFEEAERLVEHVAARLKLKPADARRLLNHDGPARRDTYLDIQWAHALHAACDALRDGTAQPAGLFASVFWLRLYGALTDLRSRFRPSAEAHRSLVEEGKIVEFYAAAAEVFDACDAIKNSLSDEELVFAAFVRHCEAHVYQDSFKYTVDPGNAEQNQPGAIRTKQMIRTLRRHMDIDDVHRIVGEVSARWGHDPIRIAVNFAHKVGPQVERLQAAMSTLNEQRDKDQQLSDARRPVVARSWPTGR